MSAELVISMRPVSVTRDQAAQLLGCSLDSFERHIQPDLKLVRKGKLRLVPVSELERWVSENAERTLP
jgi:hypothetical protein